MYVTLQNDKRFDKYLREKATCWTDSFKKLIKIIIAHESKATK